MAKQVSTILTVDAVREFHSAECPIGSEIRYSTKLQGNKQKAITRIALHAFDAGLNLAGDNAGLKGILEQGVKAGLPGFAENLEFWSRLDSDGKNQLSTPWKRAKALVLGTPAKDEDDDTTAPKLSVMEVLMKAARKALKAEMGDSEFLIMAREALVAAQEQNKEKAA